MRRASKYGFSNLDTAYELTAYLWTLRLLVLFSDGTNFYPELCTKDAELTSFLKLPERDSLHTPAKLLQVGDSGATATPTAHRHHLGTQSS